VSQSTAPDIVNLWFDHHFPLAYTIGKELSTWSNSTARLHFTAQSWIVDLFVNCPGDLGLHCPNDTALAQFSEAVNNVSVPWRVCWLSQMQSVALHA
jgi:hypothetical protein